VELERSLFSLEKGEEGRMPAQSDFKRQQLNTSYIKMRNADGTLSILKPSSSQHETGDRGDTTTDATTRPPIRVKGIGWVGRTENGDFCVHFEDGIQITLSSNGQELYYVDVCDENGPKIYSMENEFLPSHVKEKLPKVAKAMKSLRSGVIK
jgi:hypothetical protein